jgi:tRNA(Met) cytidine acetyltransferase
MNVPQAIRQAQQLCQTQRWRLPLWLQGEFSFVSEALQSVIADDCQASEQQTNEDPVNEPQDRLFPRVLCIGDAEPLNLPWPVHSLKGPARTAVLGHEAEVLIINAFSAVDWELVAAASGTLKAGGLWLLLTPVIDDWLAVPNAAAKRLLTFPQRPSPSVFAKLLAPQFRQALQWHRDGVVGDILQTLHEIPTDNAANLAEYDVATPVLPEPSVTTPEAPYASHEQALAVAAILHVVTGHRRRPLVLTAHRGRGKSAALGIAAAQLALTGRERIVICAPHPDAALVAQQQFALLIPDKQLPFLPVDRLLDEQPELDLLLIDEAAGIPVPHLEQLTTQYSRIVFASTEHGYEGTGRGFTVRFQHFLSKTCPGWKKLHLSKPIRYAANDPLEQLVFSAFLLDCDTEQRWQAVADIAKQPSIAIECSRVAISDLVNNPNLLRQVFALLSLAHYQTSLRDLWALCDDTSIQLTIMQNDNVVLGVALVGIEGELASPLCQQIALGERRVQGHLLAQSLAFHLQTPELAAIKLARVQRIVIHPLVQRRGFGEALLEYVTADLVTQQIELLGTSFGASHELTAFWQRFGFAPVRLSHKLEQSSNAPSVLMIKPLKLQLFAKVGEIVRDFRQQLYWQIQQEQMLVAKLAGHKANLAPSLLRLWVDPPQQQLSAHQYRVLRNNLLRYQLEPVLAQLQIWLNSHISNPTHPLIEPLITLLWQGGNISEFEQILRKLPLNELESLFP